ncbi:MAG: hypothetical protein ACOC80_16735 [Petrotogales bacterium]
MTCFKLLQTLFKTDDVDFWGELGVKSVYRVEDDIVLVIKQEEKYRIKVL